MWKNICIHWKLKNEDIIASYQTFIVEVIIHIIFFALLRPILGGSVHTVKRAYCEEKHRKL
jgi:hypothetical protein